MQVHTEAVTGVVGRAELLSAAFFLLSLRSYVSIRENGSNNSNFRLAASLLLSGAAMLSKEQGLTSLAACAAYEVFVTQGMTARDIIYYLSYSSRQKQRKPHLPPTPVKSGGCGGGRRPIISRGGLRRLAALSAFAAAALWLRLRLVQGGSLPRFTRFDNPASASPSPARQLTYAFLTWENLRLLLCPSSLCCDWTMGAIPIVESLSDPRCVLAAFALSLVAALMVKGSLSKSPRPGESSPSATPQKRQRRTKSPPTSSSELPPSSSPSLTSLVLFSSSLMILPFLPASNLLFPVGFVLAERVLYLPSVGFCLLVALGYEVADREIIRRSRRTAFSRCWRASLGLLLLTHSARYENKLRGNDSCNVLVAY